MKQPGARSVRRRIGLALAVTSLACRLDDGPARGASGAAGVELAAARRILGAHPAPSDARVHLDPAFAAAGSAPGVRTGRLRPAARSKQLADALGASVSGQRAADAVYLILSEPVLTGDSAALSATVVYPTGLALGWSSQGYETLALTLRRRDGGAWRVERVAQLGIQ